MALAGRLFHVGTGGGVTESAHGYLAIGQGSDHAVGSLHSTGPDGISDCVNPDPKDRVHAAVLCAIAHDAHCGGEPVTMFLESEPTEG